MKKIAIFQYDLSMGGIQKSLINLLSNFDKRNYEIDLYLFDNNNFFDKNLDVNIIYLKKYPYFCRFIPFNLLKTITKKQVNKEYDIVIDFNSYSMECAVNAVKTKAKKKIIWCHNDLEKKYENDLKYRILWFFFKKKYNYFDEVVAVSEGAKESVIKKLNIEKNKVKVIPNMIDTKEIIEKSKQEIDFIKNKDHYNLVTVGRICHQKGYDILVDLIKETNNKELDLYIIGDGEDYNKIKKQIEDYNLNNIYLLGKTNNPFMYMKQMDGFILTSRYEGQGMVILEAKTLGLDIFISKHLEKYIENIKGYEDLIPVLRKLHKDEKSEKKIDDLKTYNDDILNKFNDLLKD